MYQGTPCHLLLEMNETSLVCRLTGNFVFEVVPALETALMKWMESHTGDVRLHLKEVVYVDEDAVGMLCRLREAAVSSGNRLTLDAKPIFRFLLHTLGLGNLFQFEHPAWGERDGAQSRTARESEIGSPSPLPMEKKTSAARPLPHEGTDEDVFAPGGYPFFEAAEEEMKLQLA